MKLPLMLRVLHRTEHRMASSLLGMADRHVVEHEIHHVAKDLARWSQQHVHELAELGRQRDINLADNAPEDAGVFGALEQKASELTGDRPEPALLLLAAPPPSGRCRRGLGAAHPRRWPTATTNCSRWPDVAAHRRCGKPNGQGRCSRSCPRRTLAT